MKRRNAVAVFMAAGLACILTAAGALADTDSEEQAWEEREIGSVYGKDGEDGNRVYSVDDGDTWISEEMYEKLYPNLDPEWWTYAEYKAYVEEQEKLLQEMAEKHVRGYTSQAGVFVWDQQMADKVMEQYQQELEKMEEGIWISKPSNSVEAGSTYEFYTDQDAGREAEYIDETIGVSHSEEERNDPVLTDTVEAVTDEKAEEDGSAETGEEAAAGEWAESGRAAVETVTDEAYGLSGEEYQEWLKEEEKREEEYEQAGITRDKASGTLMWKDRPVRFLLDDNGAIYTQGYQGEENEAVYLYISRDSQGKIKEVSGITGKEAAALLAKKDIER